MLNKLGVARRWLAGHSRAQLVSVLLPRAGEKLSESNAADVRELCTTLLNAYLIQLLETGHLHADPHPGTLGFRVRPEP